MIVPLVIVTRDLLIVTVLRDGGIVIAMDNNNIDKDSSGLKELYVIQPGIKIQVIINLI
jgi:hypothetical protein